MVENECGSILRIINVAAGVKIYCGNILSRMRAELKTVYRQIYINISKYQNTSDYM